MKAAAALVLIWAVLALAGLAAVSSLELEYRLDAFLPAPESERQALAVDQVGSGPGGRMIMAALSGPSSDELARVSDAVAEAWRSLEGVERVNNGRFEIDPATRERLMRQRFLLLPDPQDWLDPERIEMRLTDLLAESVSGGPLGGSLARRDPLGMIPALAERLLPEGGAQRIDGVWFDAHGERALLVVTSEYPPFETHHQADLLESLQQSASRVGGDAISLELAGTPVISVDSAQRARRTAGLLGAAGGLFVVVVLLWAWRSPVLVVAGAVPLAAGAVTGLAATSLAFSSVHGLTLAFGVTLLGVALDYPLHLFSHAAGGTWRTAARSVRRPLLLGMLSSVVAYLAIWQSTSPGLAQLGVFCATGLPVAAAATLGLSRIGLAPPPARAPTPRRFPVLRRTVAAVGLISMVLLAAQGEGRWSDSLERLSPVDAELVAADLSLREALGAGDVRYLLVVTGDRLDDVLARTEQATAALSRAREHDRIESWQAVDVLLPSRTSVAARRAAWPAPEEMARRLEAAGPRFRQGAFDPFLEDLAALPDTEAPDRDTWAGTPLAGRIDSLLSEGKGGWRSIIVPAGIDDPEALSGWLDEQTAGGAELVDLKAVTEAMVAGYRRDAGISLVVAAAVIGLLLLARLESPAQVGRVVLAPVVAVLVTAALMSVFDGGLSIVHLIGLLLVAGIGLDLSLFAHTLADGPEERARTVRALALCALSSGGVFALLGQSGIGLLRMLGLTVALGILLSWLLTRITQPE